MFNECLYKYINDSASGTTERSLREVSACTLNSCAPIKKMTSPDNIPCIDQLVTMSSVHQILTLLTFRAVAYRMGSALQMTIEIGDEDRAQGQATCVILQ